ncbi:MAG: hypothetical protein KAW09_08720, partial [Thermoplasmata archaeon]|nr:hypothetical protein [Thermoplasmata archaeon]
GSWAFGAGDILPPLGVSPAPHNVVLIDVDGNAKLVWADPLGTIAEGNPVVMDKAEWGTHLGDSEATGGDTIGLDKGDGSVWDPNLAACAAPDIGYARIDPNVDTDKDTDWWCGGGLPEIPQLWPLGTVGYETDYLDPETGDVATNFVWQVWYAHDGNDGPIIGPLLNIYDQATGIDIPLSPFPMTFTSWVGANNDYVHPTGGAIYAHTMSGFAQGTYCYYIEVTAANGMSNQTTDMCFTIGDATGPDILNVLLDGATSVLVNPGDLVLLTSDVDDTLTGGSIIGGAEWSEDCLAPWTAMTAQDGDFNEMAETAEYTIDTAAMLGTYLIYVRAWDVVPNTNNTCVAFATLNVGVADTFPPDIYEPLVDGQVQVTVTPGTMVTFTAIIDDSNQGNSNIGGAMYSLDMGPDTAMAAEVGGFDTPNETATADIDTTGLADGAHTVCVSDAWDDAVPANHVTTGLMCATINIDGTAPTVT